MRVVTDGDANTWIGLELPPARGQEGAAKAEAECNSGAEWVSVVVPRDWESLSEAGFTRRIRAALGR